MWVSWSGKPFPFCNLIPYYCTDAQGQPARGEWVGNTGVCRMSKMVVGEGCKMPVRRGGGGNSSVWRGGKTAVWQGGGGAKLANP